MKPPAVFNFYTTFVEVAFLTSDQVGQKLDFELPTNLVGGHFLFPTSCREVDFRNSVQLGQNYFLHFFFEEVLKTAFSSATIWRDFF
jgi:hypothetical protein